MCARSNFNMFFYQMWKPFIPETALKLKTNRVCFRSRFEKGKLRFDCDGASGSMARPSRKPQKTQRQHDLLTITLRMSLFYRKLYKSSIERNLLGHFLIPLDDQDSPSPLDRFGTTLGSILELFWGHFEVIFDGFSKIFSEVSDFV